MKTMNVTAIYNEVRLLACELSAFKILFFDHKESLEKTYIDTLKELVKDINQHIEDKENEIHGE